MKSATSARLMIVHLLIVAFIARLETPLFAAESLAPPNSSADVNLDFVEAEGKPMPVGWRGGPPETISIDAETAHDGKPSVRIERTVASPKVFSTLTRSIPIDFKGDKIEIKGFIKTDDVSGFAGLWLREDGPTGQLEFDNMQQRQLKGTTGWTEYSIELPLDEAARDLYFGFLVSGTGKAWVGGLRLMVDGKPISEAPKVERIQTILDRDHEFDGGSKINFSQLNSVQVTNLAKLSMVWGFLKYHHPKVTSGQVQWDYELFRVMPRILAAGDQDGANQVLVRWIDAIGQLKAPIQAVPEESDVDLHSDITWLDEAALGPDLSERLKAINRSRPANGEQFYVSQGESVGNPVFDHELDYSEIKLPDSGYQLLGLFRLWNIIRYWSPYRNLVGEDWNGVLSEFIPRVALANDSRAYQLELMALIADIHDTHANLWGSLKERPPVGDASLPIVIRFIEGRPLVMAVEDQSSGTSSGLARGDIIEAIDGVAVGDLLAKWAPYYAASNDSTRSRDIAQHMGQGQAGAVTLRVQRGTEQLDIVTKRSGGLKPDPTKRSHDLPGPTFRLLSRDVAYLKLSSVKANECSNYIQQAEGTKGLIIDARNYPSEFVVFALGSHLVDKETEFVRFTIGMLNNPGEFSFTRPLTLQPTTPHYTGKVVVLVDETTQSQAEYTAMALRAAPETIVVGSTTAGADGNVSRIPLPGRMVTMISGIGVFYPDKRPTQRIGIVPDVEIQPTIAGVRAGRDELVEEAVRRILGTQITSDEVMKMIAVR